MSEKNPDFKPVKISLEHSDNHKPVKTEPVNIKPVIVEPLNPLQKMDGPESTEPVLKQIQKSTLQKLFWPALSTLVIAGASYQLYYFIEELFSISPILGSAGLIVSSIVFISGAYSLIKGYVARKRLSNRKIVKKQLEVLLQDSSYGQANDTLQKISDEISEHVDIASLQKVYLQQKQQVHNDSEIIQIYSDSVLKGLDKMALDIIGKHASESAAMIALSPLAAADMALVAWRSSKMIEEVSRVYGCPQSALGRVEISKQVLKNMMLAGASEMVAEAGVEMLGKTLTATISSKVAQGIGIGVLISRMGLQTISLCRPIEFTAADKPTISDLRKVILNRVIGLTKKNDKQLKEVEGDHNDRN